MTPRALADETIELLNPLSCHAIAAASEGETPCAAATFWMSVADTCCAVGAGAASGTTVVAGAGSLACAGAGAPLGSLSTVPVTSTPFGSSPFMAAIAAADTPVCAARPDSVSPARTVYPPCGAGAPAAGAGVDEPPGSWSAVPAIRRPFGSSPFVAASASVDTPLWAASADSVSPACTV